MKFLSLSKKTQTHATARIRGKLVHVPGENSTLKFSEADRISEEKYRQFLSCSENNPILHYRIVTSILGKTNYLVKNFQCGYNSKTLRGCL